jgi:hypothetical protein
MGCGLLPQPGGFEGFGLGREPFDSGDAPVAERPEVGVELFDLDSISASSPPVATDRSG